MRRKETLFSAITVLAITAGLTVAWRGGYFSGDKLETVRRLVSDLRALPLAPLAFVGLYVLVVVLLLSTTVMTIVGGALFGWWGFGLAWAGALLGSILAHYLGGTAGSGVVRRFFGRHPLVARLRDDMSAWDVMRLRVLPVAPFGLLDYLTGMSGIRLRLVLGATAVGIVPAMAAYAYAGTQLGRALEGNASARSALVVAGVVTGVMIVVAAAPTVAKFVARRRHG